MSTKDSCPVCTSQDTSNFLNRRQVPVHQNMPMKDWASAKTMERGDLTLFVCNACGFIYNQSFEESKMRYSSDYDNSQNYSTVFDSYLNELMESVLSKIQNENCQIVEIGCGKGDFLKRLVNKSPNITGYGFDPSYEDADSEINDRITFIKDFYSEKYANITADIVICRHVIEHVADPIGLLRLVRHALNSSPNAKLFFETPTVEWILKNQIMYDFFYEHCSYFTANSLTTVFQLTGFHVDRVSHVFSGQYLWLEASMGKSPTIHTANGSNQIQLLAQNFADKETALLNQWRANLSELSSEIIVVWGAGAKGVTFANLLDPQCEKIRYIVDINPKKQGRFLPGTGHQIIDYRDLESEQDTIVFIVMNGNYKDEIEKLLRNSGLRYTILLFEN